MNKIKSVTIADMQERFYNEPAWKDEHKTYFKMRSCVSKKKFVSEKQASKEIERTGDFTMHSYKCKFCNLYHMGH